MSPPPSPPIYVMTTCSMSPCVEVGDFLVVEEMAGRSFEPGDLALIPAFGPLDEKIVHRVIRVLTRGDERWLVTKGDAGLQPDPPIPEARALGRVVMLGRPRGNWVSLRTPLTRCAGRCAAAAFDWIATAAAADPRDGRTARALAARPAELLNRGLARLISACLNAARTSGRLPS